MQLHAEHARGDADWSTDRSEDRDSPWYVEDGDVEATAAVSAAAVGAGGLSGCPSPQAAIDLKEVLRVLRDTSKTSAKVNVK